LVAAVVALGDGTDISNRPVSYAVIALSGIAMGLRSATVRKIGVHDLPTTVLTLTLAGLGADSTLAGGSNQNWQRRAGSVVSMFVGAGVGGLPAATPNSAAARPLRPCLRRLRGRRLHGAEASCPDSVESHVSRVFSESLLEPVGQ
jgi:hypothetical protein